MMNLQFDNRYYKQSEAYMPDETYISTMVYQLRLQTIYLSEAPLEKAKGIFNLSQGLDYWTRSENQTH